MKDGLMDPIDKTCQSGDGPLFWINCTSNLKWMMLFHVRNQDARKVVLCFVANHQCVWDKPKPTSYHIHFSWWSGEYFYAYCVVQWRKCLKGDTTWIFEDISTLQLVREVSNYYSNTSNFIGSRINATLQIIWYSFIHRIH